MAADRAQNLQDTFLNHVRKTKTPLTIFLVNGVKLQGIVTWFDNFCLLLRRDGHSQLDTQLQRSRLAAELQQDAAVLGLGSLGGFLLHRHLSRLAGRPWRVNAGTGRASIQGDVVVFKLPSDNETDYIKRVIGLPGDRIQVKEGILNINGEPVKLKALGPRVDDEERGGPVTAQAFEETLPGGVTHTILKRTSLGFANNTIEYVVPPGHYFMMGDNRDNSLDSRISAVEGGVGFVPEENLVARADFLLVSRNPDVGWFDIKRWADLFRLDRSFGAIRAVHQVRKMVQPVSREELIAITDLWVDTALTLEGGDLRKMERLAAAQDRRWAQIQNAARLLFGQAGGVGAGQRSFREKAAGADGPIA